MRELCDKEKSRDKILHFLWASPEMNTSIPSHVFEGLPPTSPLPGKLVQQREWSTPFCFMDHFMEFQFIFFFDWALSADILSAEQLQKFTFKYEILQMQM